MQRAAPREAVRFSAIAKKGCEEGGPTPYFLLFSDKLPAYCCVHESQEFLFSLGRNGRPGGDVVPPAHSAHSMGAARQGTGQIQA